MANHAYMTITGTTQGLISAECSTQNSIGNKCQAGHLDEIMVLAYTHNMTNTTHAVHNPVIITKNIDKSSPLIARAMATMEKVDCKIDFYRTSSFGTQEKYYTVELREGIIADLTVELPHVLLSGDAQPQEHVAFRYKDITWTHHSAGTTGYSLWEEGRWTN
jgi:type VI secretion system Hcp family effector